MGEARAQTLTCIRCPRGCQVLVELDEAGGVIAVSGNACKRGEAYARAEVANPVRTVTTTVPVVGSALERRVSCKTSREVPKDKVLAVMDAARRVTATAPIAIGDVLAKNIADTSADLIATKRV